MWTHIQPLLTNKIILPLWAFTTGASYLRDYHALQAYQWRPLEEIQADQIRKLKTLLTHAYKTSIYYQKGFDDVGFSPDNFRSLADLKRLPYLTKHAVRTYRHELVSRTYPSEQLIKNATGGSTGTPVSFYATKDREAAHAATIALNYEWAGLKPGDRLAMIWGSTFDATKYQNWKGKITNMLLGRLFLPGFLLSDDIFKQMLAQLKTFRPKTLLGYTSILMALAEYLERESRSIPHLISVISGAETLYPHQREYLEKIFRCPVFNRYGGRDSGAVAAECPEARRMHINANIVYVEESPAGHIIVTDLINEGMPLIRYDTEDIGRINYDRCACGRQSPYLDHIEGRVHDLLITPTGDRVPGEFFPHLFKDVPSIRQFQVIQRQPNELTIRVVKADTRLNKQDLDYIRSRIKQYFGQINIHFVEVDEIPKLASGKFRFTIADLPIEEKRYAKTTT